MKAKLVTTLVAVPLLALSTLAGAAEPVQLSAAEMDGVTAGGISGATALSLAVGRLAATSTEAFSSAQVLASQRFEVTTIQLVGTISAAASSASAL